MCPSIRSAVSSPTRTTGGELHLANYMDATNKLLKPIEGVGQYVIDAVAKVGDFSIFLGSFFSWAFRPPYRFGQLMLQLEQIGVNSLPIIIMTALFSGMTAALQVSYVAHLFNVQSLVGASVALGAAREAAPVMTALMLTARCGSSMAAELGTMRVTEQIDALDSMAVNPVQYLVVPRVVATLILMPMLAIISDFFCIFGAYVVMVKINHVDSGVFFETIRWYLDPIDIYIGLYKAVAFGFVLASVSCFMGYSTEGGAKGVGKATTGAVVVSSVAILAVDYLLTMLLHAIDTVIWKIA